MMEEFKVICYEDSSVNQWEIYKKVSDWIHDKKYKVIIEDVIVYYNGDDGDYYLKIHYTEV